MNEPPFSMVAVILSLVWSSLSSIVPPLADRFRMSGTLMVWLMKTVAPASPAMLNVSGLPWML